MDFYSQKLNIGKACLHWTSTAGLSPSRGLHTWDAPHLQAKGLSAPPPPQAAPFVRGSSFLLAPENIRSTYQEE